MNLSKTEKLLAAKKKLKEFQMNKMTKEPSTKRQNDVPDPSVPQQCQIADSEVLEATGFQQEERMPETLENFRVPPNLEPHDVRPPPPLPNLENMDNADVRVEKERTDSSPEPNPVTEDFQTAQKEHLLEMASAVADVLTNNSESTMDTDLAFRNQFLNSYLEEQKRTVNDLHVEISNYRSRVAELESKLAAKEAEFQTQLARQIDPLKEQLQAHAQTAGILIAEKAELTAALGQTQQSARQSAEEAEELSGKLKQSQVRVGELEKELAAVRSSNDEMRKNSAQLQTDYGALENKFFELRKEKEDLSLETSELRQKLNLKKTELVGVRQELQEKTALLSLSELRIQQMTDATQTEDEKHAVHLLEQELARTRETLKVVSEEKDEASKQYQNYVRQLDAQQAKLAEELKVQKKNVEDLEIRERSYVQRLSELEQQLQHEREKTEALLPLRGCQEHIDNLTRNIDELTLEQEKLHIILADKDSQIEALTREVKELQESGDQGIEASKLATALESEQVGASRAVLQNQRMKQQLTEMENAFVSFSYAKLDLTEQLQAERTIGRKLNAQLNDMEAEIEKLKEALKQKDDALVELEKERLQHAQIADQMQHYQAQSHGARTLQQELQHALLRIESLEKENQELIEKSKEANRSVASVETNTTPTVQNHLAVEENDENEKIVENVENMDNDTSYNSSCLDPGRRLEERFKETMERVAELTEEKQKLEHLVLQLQSETETIGEYISLYQKQRAVLQGRAREKEQLFRQVLEQRNQQQEQLHKLKVLVGEFLRKQFLRPNGTDAVHRDVKGSKLEARVETKGKEEGLVSQAVEQKSISELLDVLAEIKDCNDSCYFEPNCPWCSGKLITV